jgi:hypothetical protein
MIFYDKRVVKINELNIRDFIFLSSAEVLQKLTTYFSVISDDCNDFDLKVNSLGFVKCLDYDVFFQLETLCCDFSSLLDFLRSCNVNWSPGPNRRKIRLVEGNAKRCHLKKLTRKGTSRQVFICLLAVAQNPKPPLHTVYLYTVNQRGS